MTMKKVSLGLIFFLLVSGGVYYYYEQKIKYVVWDSDIKIYASVDQLIKDSDLIVIGAPTETKNHVIIVEDMVEEAHTITNFKIDKVVSMEFSNKSKHITIIEPYFFYNLSAAQKIVNSAGKMLISDEGYIPMDDKQRYMLFLKLHKDGDMYLINGSYQGKYNISSDHIETNHNDSHIQTLYKEVLNKFEMEIEEFWNEEVI